MANKTTSNEQSAFPFALTSLFSLSLVSFLGKSYENLLRGIDSNIHAAVSLAVTRQDFLPTLPMRTRAGIFNDHPFFYFWLNGHVMRALEVLSPISSWTARCLTGIFSSGCVFLVYFLGKYLHSSLFGFLSAILFLFTRDVILTGATVSLDPPMLFFILLSYLFFLKNRWWETGIAAGVGLWIKSPVVLLIFPVAFILIFSQEKKERFSSLKKLTGAALIALLIGSLVWIYTGMSAGWNYVTDYWSRQVWGTAIEGRNLSNSLDLWMFFRWLKNGFIPGLPFLIFSLIQLLLSYFKRNAKDQPDRNTIAARVSLISVGVLFVCITPIRFKMDYYFNPAFPFLALLSAYPLETYFKNRAEILYRKLALFTPLLLAVLLCCPISFGPEAFLALRKMIPYLREYGQCDDTILLIRGGEPYGSSSDYELVLGHYSGHHVVTARCEQVKDKLSEHPRIEWVIASAQNAKNCLPEHLFVDNLRVGEQSLLSKRPLPFLPFDLSPIEGELIRNDLCVRE